MKTDTDVVELALWAMANETEDLIGPAEALAISQHLLEYYKDSLKKEWNELHPFGIDSRWIDEQ